MMQSSILSLMETVQSRTDQPREGWSLQGDIEVNSPEEALRRWLAEHPEHEGGIYFIQLFQP